MAQLIDSNATLWQNVLTLMTSKFGGRSIKPFAAFCGVGVGTIQRIEKQETSVGLETLDKIAQKFDLAAWQLLVPGFDPDNPPALQPVSRKERDMYDKIMKVAKEIAAQPGSQGHP
jgi:transcriptional regulator with XRE-family HTH domain